MNGEENKTVTKNNVMVSWLVPWLAGGLFTLGYLYSNIDFQWFAALPVLSKLGVGFVWYLLWPLFLGIKLSGMELITYPH